MNLRFLVSCLLGASGILAQQPPSLEFNSSTTCTADTSCPGAATAGFVFETSQHAYPHDPFYTLPSTFSTDLDPGSVLAIEEGTDVTNYTIPSGLTMSRILYTTTDLNGTVQPASAYILWPANLPSSTTGCDKDSPLSLVAWAHGTSGVFPSCAPSNYKALQYHFMVPFALALQGMVVVAPDYAGLGVGSLPNGEPIPHAYTAAPAQANDIANAVIAARAAFPNHLSANTPFVTAGHSQGGGVAWAFAERQAVQPIPGYRGTLAFAPSVDSISQIAAANREFATGNATDAWVYASLGFVQHSVIAGVTAVYPSFNYTGMTPIVFDRFHHVLAKIQGCLPTDSLVFSDVPFTDSGVPSWTDHPTAREFQDRVRGGNKKVAGPLLVISGELDDAVPHAFVDAAVDKACVLNSNGTTSIEFVTYKDQNHFPVIQASQSFWIQWVKDRLAGKPAMKGACTKRTVDSFRNEFNKQSTLPNWLVTGVTNPQDAWEHSL